MSSKKAQRDADREAAQLAHVVAQRAIRRLDMLEWLIFAGGAVFSTMAGALIAWILSTAEGLPFRSTWISASLLLFIVLGTAAIIKIRKEEQADAQRSQATPEGDDG